MEKKANLKEMSTKQRIGYIWDYYKWHMIGAVLAVSVAASILHHFITYREPLLNIIMINGGNNAVSEENNGFNEFLSAYGYDPSESPIACSSFYFPENDTAVSSAYLEQQALIAIIAAGEQDIFLGNGTVYENYCRQGALVDLSTILSPELLSSYEDSLIYADTEENAPYPCAIELSENPWLSQYGYTGTCRFGILTSFQNEEACKEFAEFLLTMQ